MKDSAVHIEHTGYDNYLRKYNFHFREDKTWLIIGKRSPDSEWRVFISAIRKGFPELLDNVLPVLYHQKISFKLVKDRLLHQSLNYGRYGSRYVGKIITLYPRSGEQAVELIQALLPLLEKTKGPKVDHSAQIGSALFVSFCRVVTDRSGKRYKQQFIPKRKQIPFAINTNQNIYKNQKITIGKYYIPIRTIRESSKGDIYKALCLKSLRFNPCIIKQGRPNMVDDLWGRTIRDRLLWQQQVLLNLRGKMDVPRIIDFFEENGNSYLVMEYKNGYALTGKIQILYQHHSWKDFSSTAQLALLTWFLQSLEIINNIHCSGYIHRDIKDENFLVLPNGRLFLVDYELAYSVQQQLPDPPFKSITPGYQAPEQLNNAQPATSEDIYSLGGLLLFLLTGTHPKKFLSGPAYIRVKLQAEHIDASVIELIVESLTHEADKRPTLTTMLACIHDQISRLSSNSSERSTDSNIFRLTQLRSMK